MVSKASRFIVYLLSALSVLTLLFFAISAQRLISDLWDETEAKERESIRTIVNERANYIYSELENIYAFVYTQKDYHDFEEHLEAYSHHILDNVDGVINFSVAPNGIQTYVYPLEGNESVLGHDLLNDERDEVRLIVNKAIETKTAQMNGPYPMRTNPDKSIVVFRYPMFNEDNSFYGLINIVLTTEELFFPSISNFESDMYDIQIVTEEGITVYGEQGDWIDEEEFLVEGFNWTIRYSFKDSYIEQHEEVISRLDYVFLSAFVVIIIIGLFFIRKTKLLSIKIDDLVYYDDLTGLPNRRLLEMDLMNQSGNSFTLCFLDVDDFKYINDTYGHDFGDGVLTHVSSVLKTMFNNMVYRWGGDEFVILLPLYEEEQLKETIDELYSHFLSPIDNKGISLMIGFSMGILANKNNTFDLEECIQLADMAMYTAKHSGKNTYRFYDEEFSHNLRQLYKFDQLSRTMDFEEQGDIYFQPRYSFKTSKMVGLEALFRIIDEDSAYLPYKFIQAAENNRTIIELDKFGLRRVLSYIPRLDEAGITVPIAVNVSGISIMSNFDDYLIETMSKSKIESSRIAIEITEGVSISNAKHIIETLSNIKAQGFKIMMDDFGKEYSGLTNLANMPFNAIKIDRAFVENIHDENTYKIIKTIIELGHKMNLEVVAEGVESKEQFDLLKELSCDSFQGFLFDQPISVTLLIEKYGNKNKEG